MGNLSPHFHVDEFRCRCGCGGVRIDPRLVFALEAIREHFSAPVIITSGYRCRRHNRDLIGASPTSHHRYGRAADIQVADVSATRVSVYCDELIGDRGGVGTYSNFVHIDVRGKRARWIS